MKSAYGLEIPESLAETITPDKCALIVYDMQKGILDHINNPARVIGKVKRVLEMARRVKMRTVFMRHLG